MFGVLLTYAPLGTLVAAGLVFMTHTKRRLLFLEHERQEAREYSFKLEAKVQDIALTMSTTHQEVMGMVRGLAAKKARGTPISAEEAQAAAELVADHQAAIEALLNE
jgi:hypothetical protein